MKSMFLSHGSPMNALAENGYTRFLQGLGERMKPDAILIVSAHWEEKQLTLTRTDAVYETIYDFYGFPPELYRVKYPARGSVEMADKIVRQLEHASFPCRVDERRGMDHGSWTLLVHLFPKADIPVVQMSLNASLDAKEQVRMARALLGLKGANLLVIGSGVSVHNLRLIDWDKDFSASAEPWALEFDDWLIENSPLDCLDKLQNYLELAPHAHKAAPTLEHFVPYLIARGAGDALVPQLLYRGYELGNLSYLGVEF